MILNPQQDKLAIELPMKRIQFEIAGAAEHVGIPKLPLGATNLVVPETLVDLVFQVYHDLVVRVALQVSLSALLIGLKYPAAFYSSITIKTGSHSCLN